MDIYSFINSPDVAAYCREINKVWNPFEMAVIISSSSRPMADKHTAWREIISSYPDMPTPKNMHYNSYISLHQKLAEVIDYEERLLALIKKPEPGAVYIHKVWRHKECRYSDTIFTSYDKTLADAKDSWERDESGEIRIEKTFVDDADSNKGKMEIIIDYDGVPYWISAYGNNAGLFPDIDFKNLLKYLNDSFYVDIPVPFKHGDILSLRDSHGRRDKIDDDDIFVLDSVDRDDQEIQARRLRGEMSDGTDLMGSGYFVDDDGLLSWGHAEGYDCYEYYRGKLTGKAKILHYVNLFINKKIMLPELLAMQCRIIMEHKLDSSFPVKSYGCYIPENLLAENRLTNEEKEQIKQGKALVPWVVDKLNQEHIDFLAKETKNSVEAVQNGLCDGGGWLMGRCAEIVHQENHYARTNDNRFNNDRRATARLILERYGKSENGWVDSYLDPNYREDGLPPFK